jgi:hypothetical protein
MPDRTRESAMAKRLALARRSRALRADVSDTVESELETVLAMGAVRQHDFAPGRR